MDKAEIAQFVEDKIIEGADTSDSVIRHVFRLYESGTITRADLTSRITDRENELAPPVEESPAITRVSYGKNEYFLRQQEGWAESILVRDRVKHERDTRIEIEPYITVEDIAVGCLRRHHLHVPEDKAARIEAAMKMGNGLTRSGVSDFAATLTSIAQKSLAIGLDNAPETWRYLVRMTETPNFLQFERHTGAELPTPQLVKEVGGIKAAVLGSGTKETAQVSNYAQISALSRHAAINDDLSAITTTMEAAGRACSRLVGDLVFAVMTGNPSMADGVQFLHATHGNVGTGGAPSVTTVDEVRKLMSAQTGPTGEVLNIRPAILVGPTSLEGTLCILRDANNASSEDDPLTPGYKAGRVAVVTDQRLDAASTAAWYACANPRQHSGIEVVTLEGSRGMPLLEKMTQWVSDAIEWRVLYDVAVLPVDYRTWIYNPGA